MELKPKETLVVPVITFLGMVVVATLGWILLLFLVATGHDGPIKPLMEIGIEALKVIGIGAAAAIILELFLRRTLGNNPENILEQVGITSVFPSRRDPEAAHEYLRLATDPNVRHLMIAGISLRDFLLGNGSLNPIWKAIRDRLEAEHKRNLPAHERLTVRLLLLDPRSNEGCFRHEVEGLSNAAPGGGIPFDVPQGINTVVAAQRSVYGDGESWFLHVRTYEHCPFAFFFAADTAVLVEQYDYRDQMKDAALPLICYRSGTEQFTEILASLDTVWKHAREVQTPEEVGTAAAIRVAKIRNIFRQPDDRACLSAREVAALNAMPPGDLVKIVAITGHFYISNERAAPLLRQISQSTNGGGGTEVRIAIVNPTSQQAILRAIADGSPADEIARRLEEWSWTQHQDTRLYKDARETIKYMDQWKMQGCRIELKLYSSSIACAMLLTGKSAFVEQYVYGRSKVFQPGVTLGGEYPLFEYEKARKDNDGTVEEEVLEQTFDIIWNSYSITSAEYAKRDPSKEFERNHVALLEELGKVGTGPGL